MATVDENGVTGTSLQEYKALIEAAYLAIDPNWNIEPDSPDGQQIAIWAEQLANADEQIVLAYQSLDPLTAIGAGLERMGFISGVIRQGETFSTATVQLTGISGTTVLAGTEVLNIVTGTIWTVDNDITLVGGTALVNVTCTESGAQTADVGELASISFPGISSVTNLDAASPGRAEEPESVFRVRRQASVANPGDNQVDSMIASVGDVIGVKRVKIIENFNGVPDADGVEAHSLAIFVDGGENLDIGNAIAATKNPGCSLNELNTFPNKVTVEATTPNGNPFPATFFRPDITTVYVDVAITGDGIDEDDVKQAIVDYSNATLFNTEDLGFDRTGINIGEDVHAGKLFTPVNSVVGSKGHVTSLLIGSDEYDVNYTTIAVGFNGLGVFDVDNITVTVTPS